MPAGLQGATSFIYLCSHLCKPSSFLLWLRSLKLKNMLLLIRELISTCRRLPKWLSVPIVKFRDNIMILAYWVSVCRSWRLMSYSRSFCLREHHFIIIWWILHRFYSKCSLWTSAGSQVVCKWFTAREVKKLRAKI